MTIEPSELIKWGLGILSTGFLGVGAWIGRKMARETENMAADIKELQEHKNRVDAWMGKVTETLEGRDRLQDERWKNQNEKMADLKDTMNTMHRDVQAIVHSQIKTNRNSEK